MDTKLKRTLQEVARFYDARKVGDVGSLGFRRSTDLSKMRACLDPLIREGLIRPGQSFFLDMGCADGRVNVFLSYLLRQSVGIELDPWTLDEYGPLRKTLETRLKEKGLLLPPDNITLFHGDSTDEKTHHLILKESGIPFDRFDLFYTYLVMQEEFAQLIVRKAKQGAVFMLYGLESIQPRFRGLRLLTTGRAMEGILSLYLKT